MDQNNQYQQNQPVYNQPDQFTPQPQPQKNKGNGGVFFIVGLLAGCLLATTITMVASSVILKRRNDAQLQQKAQDIVDAQQETESILTPEVEAKIQSLEGAIDQYYYKTDVDKAAEVEGMYKGLVASLGDPYSEYFTKEETEDWTTSMSGKYSGIGAVVSINNELSVPTVSKVLEGSPAQDVGLQMGDVISAVDGDSTDGKSLSEVVSKIRGEEGTTVKVTIMRNGEKLDFDITRKQLDNETVSSNVMDNGIGYLKIEEFDTNTYEQFKREYDSLKEQDIKALIIDLRSNPGGSLDVVCKIARELLPAGNIVYTVDRDGNKEEFTCDGANEIKIPVAVLVNEYSASASEILSGAIKDYGIGTIVGKQTYGKGVVQRMFSFTDGTAVKITISNYYTPNGNDINGVGIEPDVEVDLDVDKYQEDRTDTQLDKAVEVINEKLGN